MNSCISAAVKGQSIGLVTAIVDGESQSSKEVTEHIHLQIAQKNILPGYPPLVQRMERGREMGCNRAT